MRNTLGTNDGYTLLRLQHYGARWVAVVDYGQRPGGGRRGCWCEDTAGGWGTSYSPEKAIAQCARPVSFRTRREALAHHDDLMVS